MDESAKTTVTNPAIPASRDVLEKIVENISIHVFWMDADSRYLGCNTAFARDARLVPSP